MIAEIKRAQSEAGPEVRRRRGRSRSCPTCSCAPAADGSWLVELNSDTLPRVLVNRRYYATVARRRATKQDKSYLAECLQTANWLVKSLDQRARTILKVAEEIVRQQDALLHPRRRSICGRST